MTDHCSQVNLDFDIEESFDGYDIFVENNPDRYRGGFMWSAGKDDDLWDSGLAFTVEAAMTEAKAAIKNFR